MGRKFFRKPGTKLAIALALALAGFGWLRPRAGSGEEKRRVSGPGIDSGRGLEERTRSAATNHRRSAQRQRELRQRAALELSGRMREPALKYPVTRMAYKGERFPRDLLDELAAMDAEQFQTVALAFGKDRTIHAATRTTVLIEMMRAWMARQAEAEAPPLGGVLGVIEELFPEFPPGYDVLPVNCVIDLGARWDAEAMAGFIVKHWDRWGGPHGERAEMLRQSMLRHAGGSETVRKLMQAPASSRTGP